MLSHPSLPIGALAWDEMGWAAICPPFWALHVLIPSSSCCGEALLRVRLSRSILGEPLCWLLYMPVKLQDWKQQMELSLSWGHQKQCLYSLGPFVCLRHASAWHMVTL